MHPLTIGIGVAILAGSVMSPAPIHADRELRSHYSIDIEDMYRMNSLAWYWSPTPCGTSDDAACFDGTEVFVQHPKAAAASWYFDFLLWHEFHHYVDQVDGIPYVGLSNECAADAYAFAHIRTESGPINGYVCSL